MEVGNLYIVLAVTRSAATLAGNRKNVSINHPALYLQQYDARTFPLDWIFTVILSCSFRMYLVVHTS